MLMTNELLITRVMNAVAAGTSDQNSTTLDMQGYDGVVFVALFGALTANQVTKLRGEQGQLSDASDMASLAGTAVGPLADTDGNKALVLEINRPQERYVRCVVDRGTANAVIDGMLAVRYKGIKRPESLDATIMAMTKTVSPDEGTP